MQSNIGSRAFQNARLQKKFKKEAEALLAAAYAAFGNGRRAEVEANCRRILQVLPDHFDALHLLGVCLSDAKRLDEAEQLLRAALTVNPRSANVHCDLGTVLFELKRYEDARVCQERAVALDPKFPMALTNLGNTVMHLGLAKDAIELHDRAIRLKPDYADAYCNRGMAELRLAQHEKAAQSFERALSLQPRHLEAIAGRGIANLELCNFEVAEAAFNQALALRPNSPRVLAQRARLHLVFHRLPEANADLDAALALSPRLELALRNKALVSLHLKHTTSAMATCKTLLEENPRSEVGLVLLGACLASLSEIDSALEHFDRAIEIKPDFEDAITHKIFTLDFLPTADFAVLQAARRYWWDAIGTTIAQRELPPRDLDPQRRLVVGYVSADFRKHSAGFTFLPVLRHHDRAAFEVICYSCSNREDEVTAEFRKLADGWVDATVLTDEALADRIVADKVDILVDLSGHSAGNRLRVFARKPAPIQVSAWGNPTGTGLPTIDYVLADPISIPQSARHLFAEKIYDLPCMLTAEPMPGLHRPELPMLRNGYVTFGVFNRIDKISDEVLVVWVKLLDAVAGSKIMIKHGALDDSGLRDALIGRFVERGIAADRIVCLGSTARDDHLRAYGDIDISLDPFPQNGGASTWESLHMGVPVVAKLGTTTSSRAAAAILKGIGLDDWVSDDAEGYVAIAERFARAPDSLAALRRELPARIEASAAGNGALYTQAVEAGYRQFWRDYGASQAK
ncbi:acetylglucosamine transferase [Bradyrhizobium guangdongense]|uniref:O-linked N-acetylglucosamine transferase, SPINDLY family protein n=1 Tax=Bradyrhizobium guangdongense TaxID=1325090 RepID=UPI00112BD332|nr:tetratricopeptide repeat protein [Bradyrhizobium guangdongense]TPQ38398.1 acetylglucosamine transferase [Bradyrhizobium guangdongense]